jgi:hypothetical protein
LSTLILTDITPYFPSKLLKLKLYFKGDSVIYKAKFLDALMKEISILSANLESFKLVVYGKIGAYVSLEGMENLKNLSKF